MIYETQVVERREKQNAGVKFKTKVMVISARRQKLFPKNEEGRDILPPDRMGRRYISHRCAVQFPGSASFNRFKNEGHGVTASYVTGRWFNQHRWIRFLLLKLS